MIRKQATRATTTVLPSAILSLIILSACSSSSDVMVEGVDNTMSTDAAVTDEVQTDSSMPAEADENAVVDVPDNTSIENSPVENTIETPVDLDIGEGNRLVERVGQLYIAYTDGPTGLEINSSAQFHRLTTPLEDAPVLRAQEGLDTCEIGSVASQLNATALAFPIDHLLTSQSEQAFQVTPTLIGESIDISSAAGSYAMLNVVESDASDIDASFASKDYQMQTGAALNTALPTDLDISVTGADFPLQWNWATPELLPVSLRDAIRQADSAPTLTWQAVEQSESRQSRIMIYAGAIDELTGGFQSYDCAVQDDGEFTLPEQIRALYSDGFSPNFVDVVRFTRTLQTIDDISIVNVFMQKF